MPKLKRQFEISRLLIIVIISMVLFSYGKSTLKPSKIDSSQTSGKISEEAGIYIADYEVTTTDFGQSTKAAKIWKDGKANLLYNGTADAVAN